MIIPIGNSQVNHIFTGLAAPTGAQVTYGVDNSTGLTAAQVAAAVHQLWIDTILESQCSTIALQSTLVKNGPNDTGESALFTDAASGSVGSDVAAPNTSALVTKNTAMGGRQGRGRLFVPAIPEGVIFSDGTLDGTYLAGFQSRANELLGSLESADLPMILLRSEDSPPQPPETVTSLTVSGLVATQRRRLRR